MNFNEFHAKFSLSAAFFDLFPSFWKRSWSPFKVTLLRFEAGCALVVSLSHVLGDGFTFYRLLRMSIFFLVKMT